MDVLTDVLESVHLQSRVFCRSELTAPWGFRVQRSTFASFHVVLRGSCWLDVEGVDQPIAISGGDLVVLPRGGAHAVRDAKKSAAPPLEDIIAKNRTESTCGGCATLSYGGGGAATTLVCGVFEFDRREANPLFKVLPPVIHIRSEGGEATRWLEATLQLVANEVASASPGGEAIVSRLADVIFIKAVRAHFASLRGGDQGWLRALTEPRIGEAIAMVHRAPAAPWTVAELAAKVGMSRSAFALRFTELVGEPPLQYVTRWRIEKATNHLREGRGIAEIASMVGYDSEAAFSKAFKRWTGSAPGVYRTEARSLSDS